MPVTRIGVQAVTGSPGQNVDIDPARITATIANVGGVAVEYSTGSTWTTIAAGATSASVSCNTADLRLRRAVSGAYPVAVDINWTAASEGESNSLTATQAQSLVSGAGKMRAAMAAAAISNPQTLAPWCAAPTWAVATAYGMGQVVRGTGGDAGNLYLMVGSNAAQSAEGTSAASGTGPSGAGFTFIADNTCMWLYIGRATGASTATPLVSTATLTGPTDAMNGYMQIISTATATAIGLTSYRPSTASTFAAEAYFTGGLYDARNLGRVNGPNIGTAAVPSYNTSSERGSIEFTTNTRKWIGLRAQSGAGIGKNVPYEVLVNGRRLSETPFVLAVTNASPVLLFNLSAFPEGPKTLEVRVYGSLQSNISFEVYTEADALTWPTENPTRWRLAIDGNSTTVGAFVCAYKPAYWLERLLGDMLGSDAVYNNGVGSTDLLNDGTTKTTALQRGADLDAFQPDLVMYCGGGTNDSGASYTSEQRQASMLAWLQARRAANPSALIVVCGPIPLQGGLITAAGGVNSVYQVEVDYKAAVDAFADANTLFIPLMTDVRNKFGSGTTAANGRFWQNAASPYNDTHPLPTLYPYLASLLADKIRAFALARA